MTWTNSESPPPWTRAQIREARGRELAPLLNARGIAVKPLAAGNYLLVEHGDLIVKHGYWRWPSRGLQGNAIDFFMAVEGRTFNQAMQVLCGADKVPENRAKLPS